MNTEYDVFISYSRKDYVDEKNQVLPDNVISKIKEVFDANGITYWFDEDGVYSGDAFAPVIARNIKASKMFLFISSVNSNASMWTSSEIATAHTYKKKILPFKYDDSVYNDAVILYIATLDFIEYRTNPQKALGRLVSSVTAYLKEEKDRQEQERLEKERQRKAEISRQERAEKLQGIRGRIHELENRRFEVETEILTQERMLTELKNEKRILELSISELKAEEAAFLGTSSQGSKSRKKDSKLKSLIKIELDGLKEAWNKRHGFANVVFTLAGLFSLVLTLSFAYITVGDSNVSLSLALGPFMMILASYRLLRNYKDSLLWLVATMFVTMVACLVASESSFYDKFEFLLGLGLIFGAFGFLLLIMALFVPYRKRPSVWVGMTGRLDHKGTDIWKLIMIVMLLLVLILNVFVFAEVI